jgi:hypothetical protein
LNENKCPGGTVFPAGVKAAGNGYGKIFQGE